MQYRELKLRYAHRLPTFGQNVQAFQIPREKQKITGLNLQRVKKTQLPNNCESLLIWGFSKL